MQMVKKSLFIILGVWLALLFFMPKAELYYTLEKELATKDIVLNEKSIDEGLFSLSVTDITVYVKGIALAEIEKLDFFTLFFYNTLNIDKLIIDESLQSQIPTLTKNAHLSHHIFAPLTLTVDANGSFGAATGNIDLKERKIHIDFIEAKDIDMIKPYLTKSEKGWTYEKSF